VGVVRISGGNLAVACHPKAGFTITSIIDEATGAEALWTRAGFTPAVFTRTLGPSGEASVESFVDLFVGGWFEMFPTAGYSGTVEGPVGPSRSLLHGEVMRLPWDIIEQSASHIEASVVTLRTPFRLTRRLEIVEDELVIHERVHNLGGTAAPYVWGHHPCFSRVTFAGGRFDLDVASATVPGPVYDQSHSALVPDTSFAFPHAPTTSGASRDVALIPEHADGRHEQTSLVLRSGGLRITAPHVGRAFTMTWDVADLPYVLLWQDYAAPGAAFWGTCDTFAVEPSSAPGRSLDDAVAVGAVRYLDPNAEATLTMRAAWGALKGRAARGAPAAHRR
jgi:galactose mutarotase-like enzyme